LFYRPAPDTMISVDNSTARRSEDEQSRAEL
jgi:hypothetical protein